MRANESGVRGLKIADFTGEFLDRTFPGAPSWLSIYPIWQANPHRFRKVLAKWRDPKWRPSEYPPPPSLEYYRFINGRVQGPFISITGNTDPVRKGRKQVKTRHRQKVQTIQDGLPKAGHGLRAL